MKGKISAIILFLTFTSFLTLNAQWARTYGTSEDEQAFFIKQTQDGGYILAGQDDSTFDVEIWIIKLSSDNNIEWQKIFDFHWSDQVDFILQTNDGGYIFGGAVGHSTPNKEFLIVKLDPDGDFEWQQQYGNYNNNDDQAHSLQQTSDGGYIVAGHTYHDNADPNLADNYDFLILKLNYNGSVEWSKTYGGSSSETPHSIQETSEGGYIVAGVTQSFGSGSLDNWIFKLASDGSIEWQKTYGGFENEIARFIQQTNDEGYIVAGYTSSFGAGSYDFWVLKLFSNGEIEWHKIFGGEKKDIAHSIQQTFDGGYVVAGETQSFGFGDKDIWILKLNIWGDIEWQKTYGGSQSDEAFFIQQISNGGFIVAGSTNTYGAGKRDFLILKLFSNGDINFTCEFEKESNAEVSVIEIIPVDTDVSPEDLDVYYSDMASIPREGGAIVYNLCSGEHTLTLSTTSGGTTDPLPGTYICDYAELKTINPVPDEGYRFIGWSGDVISTDFSLSITMDSDKSIKANFGEDILEEIWEEAKNTPCFIATAAFGSPLHPYVKTLQDFRDNYLMTNRPGRMFVKLYYKYSPPIAKLITNHKSLRTVVRIWLIPLVAMGYSMVHFGPFKTSLMLVITFMPLFIFVWIYRRRGKKD
ncbi:CFI-box-CTERM domain-containing protein [Acidobacteriota bacterium]